MRFLILFMATLLFASVKVAKVYVPEDFDYDLPIGFQAVESNDLKLEKDGFKIINYNDLAWAIKNGAVIVYGIGEVETYIVSKKPLNKIKVVANANLPAKIVLSSFSKNIKFIETDDEDELKKVDAVVSEEKDTPEEEEGEEENENENQDHAIKGKYFYDLDEIRVEFNHYYIIADKQYYERHKKEAQTLSHFFPVIKMNSSLVTTSQYVNVPVIIAEPYESLFRDIETEKLKVALTPTWPPFNFNEKGKLQGISVDFWDLIAKKAHLNYEFIAVGKWDNVLKGIRNKKYDIAPNTSITEERLKYAIFSKPYIEFPFAVACRSDAKVSKLKDIKSIAVGKNYTAYKQMKKHYPFLNYIPTDNIKSAFDLLKEKKVQCVVDILPVVMWMMNQNGAGDVKIVYKTPFNFELRVMLRKDLVDVRDEINEAIDELSVVEKNKILIKYLGEKVQIKKGFSPWLYALIAVLVLFFVAAYLKARKYKRKAEYDALTKVYNRGTIEKFLQREAKNQDGSIILFDVDHFKKINDTYGHDKGDYVLQNLAKIIKQNIRKDDYFGRWGGEEFIIILPETPFENALKIAEKLRKIVYDSDFDNLKISVSMGVSEYKKGQNPYEALKKADQALYKAKESGRNQVKGRK